MFGSAELKPTAFVVLLGRWRGGPVIGAFLSSGVKRRTLLIDLREDQALAGFNGLSSVIIKPRRVHAV